MIVLGLETSGDTASLALCQGGRLLAGRAFPSRMNLCRDLAGEIKAVLDFLPDGEALGGIAVSLGPGSFTSLRIGVVTAKAMAHQMEIPLVGVPTPVALAAPRSPHDMRGAAGLEDRRVPDADPTGRRGFGRTDDHTRGGSTRRDCGSRRGR